MSDEKEAQWGHYRDLPEAEVTMELEGQEVPWSEVFNHWWQVSEEFGAETVSATVVEIGPGQATPMHAHKPPVEEFYLVLEGTVDIEIKDPETGEVEVVEGATPGTFAYFPPGIEHRPINNYDEPTVELGFRALGGTVDEARESVAVSEDELE